MSGAAKILTALLFALPLTILLSCADGSLPPSAPRSLLLPIRGLEPLGTFLFPTGAETVTESLTKSR